METAIDLQIKDLKKVVLFLFCFELSVTTCHAEKGKGFEYELDPYYSNISWVKGFDGKKIPVISNLDELDIYKTLIQESLSPDFILFEASVNPLPILGVHLREQYPEFYRTSKNRAIDSNLIEAVTSGFEEPYALSFFMGRVVRFAPPKGMKTEGDDRGYIGYLLSVGTHHIQHNVLIRDDWLEVEWKIKGNRETELQHLSWSFRAGAKFHSHPEIGDSVMLGIHRDRVDFTRKQGAFLQDIGFDYRMEFLQKNLHPSRQQLIVDKYWPLNQDKLTFSLGFGLIWESDVRYTGSLADNQKRWSVVLRPNLRF